MLHKMLPKNNQIPKPVFKMFQYVPDLASSCPIRKHIYCRECLQYNSIDEKPEKCLVCNSTKKDYFFFFEIDMYKTQMKDMFKIRKLAEKLKTAPLLRNDNIIENITDGSEYIVTPYV